MELGRSGRLYGSPGGPSSQSGESNVGGSLVGHRKSVREAHDKFKTHWGPDERRRKRTGCICCHWAQPSSQMISTSSQRQVVFGRQPLESIRAQSNNHNISNRSYNNRHDSNNNYHRWARITLPLFLSLAVILITWTGSLPGAEAVDCFKCSSRNGSNPACEDPFHNLNTTRITSPVAPDPQPNVIYHTPCYAGKKGREGLFPASACIKLTGVFDATGETLVVRHCALDSGTLTQDTELARMSHCGKFQFDGDLLKGCVLACPDDACNSANSPHRLTWTCLAVLLALISVLLSLLMMH